MSWDVDIGDEFEPEFDALHEDVQAEILALAKVLEQLGPQLGRPRVDTLNGSSHANMKELRFDAADGVWRVAFAFDPKRKAILLVAGDKSGVSEKKFYRELIRKADERFDAHLARLKKRREVVMSVNVNDKIKKLSPALRKKVEARAAELIAEEMTLQELRKARKLTQVRMAKELGITQDSVSAWKSAATCCSQRCGRPSRPWAGNCRLWRNSPTARPWCLPGSQRTSLRKSRPGANTRMPESVPINETSAHPCIHALMILKRYDHRRGGFQSRRYV